MKIQHSFIQFNPTKPKYRLKNTYESYNYVGLLTTLNSNILYMLHDFFYKREYGMNISYDYTSGVRIVLPR